VNDRAATPTTGFCTARYDGKAAAAWARSVQLWGKYLYGHKHSAQYIEAVQAMSTMLEQALSPEPNSALCYVAAEKYHRIMLSTFPKATLRVYEHAMLVHVPDLLKQGTLLDGSSWFLEAFNKVWKNQLKFHTNNGGGVKNTELTGKDSVEGRAFKDVGALKAHSMDKQAMKSMWETSMPLLRDNEFGIASAELMMLAIWNFSGSY
jgi:hypothetical protein